MVFSEAQNAAKASAAFFATDNKATTEGEITEESRAVRVAIKTAPAIAKAGLTLDTL